MRVVIPHFTAKWFCHLWDLFTMFKRAYTLLWHSILKIGTKVCCSFTWQMACFFEL